MEIMQEEDQSVTKRFDSGQPDRIERQSHISKSVNLGCKKIDPPFTWVCGGGCGES